MNDPTDFSILGDWFGTQRKPSWRTPLGIMPFISGLPADLKHEQRKALTAAANYGCPQLFDGEHGTFGDYAQDVRDTLHFTSEVHSLSATPISHHQNNRI